MPCDLVEQINGTWFWWLMLKSCASGFRSFMGIHSIDGKQTGKAEVLTHKLSSTCTARWRHFTRANGINALCCPVHSRYPSFNAEQCRLAVAGSSVGVIVAIGLVSCVLVSMFHAGDVQNKIVALSFPDFR